MKLRIILPLAVCVFAALAMISQVGVSQTDEKDLKKLLSQLADARLKLAQTDLNLSLDENKRVPGVVAEVTIARMQLAVAHAEARAKMAQGKPEEFSIALLKPSAELAVKFLEIRTQKLEAAAAQTGDIIATIGAKKARAELEVAKAELATLGAMEGQPMALQVQWQLNQLSAAVDSLNSRVTVLEDKR